MKPLEPSLPAREKVTRYNSFGKLAVVYELLWVHVTSLAKCVQKLSARLTPVADAVAEDLLDRRTQKTLEKTDLIHSDPKRDQWLFGMGVGRIDQEEA